MGTIPMHPHASQSDEGAVDVVDRAAHVPRPFDRSARRSRRALCSATKLPLRFCFRRLTLPRRNESDGHETLREE